jgi:hypothetical protein
MTRNGSAHSKVVYRSFPSATAPLHCYILLLAGELHQILSPAKLLQETCSSIDFDQSRLQSGLSSDCGVSVGRARPVSEVCGPAARCRVTISIPDGRLGGASSLPRMTFGGPCASSVPHGVVPRKLAFVQYFSSAPRPRGLLPACLLAQSFTSVPPSYGRSHRV